MASKESDARLATNGNPCLTSTATLRMDDHKAHGTAAARIVTRQAASGLDTERRGAPPNMLFMALRQRLCRVAMALQQRILRVVEIHSDNLEYEELTGAERVA